MTDDEKNDLKQKLSAQYLLEEEPDFWIVSDKGSGAVLATLLVSSSYDEVKGQLQGAGIGV